MDVKVSKAPHIDYDILETFFQHIGNLYQMDNNENYAGLIDESEKLLTFIESLKGKEVAPGIILQNNSSFEALEHLVLARSFDRNKMCFHAQYHHSLARDITAIDSTYILAPNLMVFSPEKDFTLYKYAKNIDMDGLLSLPPHIPSNCFTRHSYYLPFYKLIDPVDVD